MNIAVRKARIEEETEGTIQRVNEFEVPDEPGRFLVIEGFSGDRIWAISCETLEECAQEIDSSETDRDNVFILDLDTDAELVPILSVTKILGTFPNDHICIPEPANQRALLLQQFPWLDGEDETPVSGSDVVDKILQWWESVK
jgi:hypothetical protein